MKKDQSGIISRDGKLKSLTEILCPSMNSKNPQLLLSVSSFIVLPEIPSSYTHIHTEIHSSTQRDHIRHTDTQACSNISHTNIETQTHTTHRHRNKQLHTQTYSYIHTHTQREAGGWNLWAGNGGIFCVGCSVPEASFLSWGHLHPACRSNWIWATRPGCTIHVSGTRPWFESVKRRSKQ